MPYPFLPHMALALHQFCTGQPKLHPGIGVNRVVNAPVTGRKAAQHLAVCRIDNGVTVQAW